MKRCSSALIGALAMLEACALDPIGRSADQAVAPAPPDQRAASSDQPPQPWPDAPLAGADAVWILDSSGADLDGEGPQTGPVGCGASPSCGDGTCSAAEDCAFCAADCGKCPGVTKTFSGNKGLKKVVASGASVYDARGAVVNVEQGTNNTGFNITASPSGARFLCGRVIGKGANLTTAWRDLYDLGNGASLRFENSPKLTIQHHYGEYSWDGIKPATGSANWTVLDSWLRHTRDDAIEADHAGAHSGVVRRTFFDGVHTFISVKPGGGAAVSGSVSLVFEDNLMSLGCGLPGGKACENRDKRLKYAWSSPTGSGQAFKVSGCGEYISLLFKNNTVMLDRGINQSGSNQVFLKCMKLQPGSTGNTFFWLGGCSYKGYQMETLNGACVPKVFQLDPAVFTVSNDKTKWGAAVAKWKADVWGGP